MAALFAVAAGTACAVGAGSDPGEFIYSQFSPKGTKFAPPDTNRIEQIAAILPEKPGWYRGVWCSDDKAKSMLTGSVPVLTEADYMLFYSTGDRRRYENKLGLLVDMITSLSVKAAKMEGSKLDRTVVMKRLNEALERFVELKSWIYPAHDPQHVVYDGKANRIDLISAHASASLAYTLLKLSKELDPGLVARIRQELDRRTFSSYLHSAAMTDDPRFDRTHMNHWFYIRDNWNSVCHAGCVEAALAVIEDRRVRAAFIEAAERAMPHYLKGFYDDGWCFEGAGYWDYGFGNFLRLTEIVRSATDRHVDFSTMPKAKEMMFFGCTSRMDANGTRPRFADSSGGRVPKQWLDLGVMLWPDLAPLRDGKLPANSWFPQAQVYIGRSEKFAFAIKGGQNDLPHCHRDIGSWVIVENGKYVAGDPGVERYTARTFSRNRFDSKILNSYGHPVPRVGGELQDGGHVARAKVVRTDFTDAKDKLVLDISDAYPCLRKGGGTLLRTMTFDRAAGTVAIRDDFKAAKPMTFDSPMLTELAEAPLAPEVTGGAWHMERDDIENPGYPTQHRHSVTFDAPVTSASVVWRYPGRRNVPEGGGETSEAILARARLVADSFLSRHPYESNKQALWWDWATLWWGVTKLGLADPKTGYVDFMVRFGEHFNWEWMKSEPVGYHADSHCIGQAYLDLALAGVTDKGAKTMRALEDRIAFEAPATSISFEWPKKGEWATGLRRWKWCDTLFMAPTVFVRMSKWTGDRRYLEFADSEFRALSDFLFSEEHGFYFRDSRFFTKKSPNGMPEFWSRGNGWVFAALAEMLEFMPKVWPTRNWYVERYNRMAKSIKAAQTPDGTWHVNLLDPQDGGGEPEMSGTCLYLYGYLWGLNNGFFSAADYGATVDRAWKAVLAEVKTDGRIGRMQRPASAPGTAGADEEAPYGVGAFLAASVEMAALRSKLPIQR